MKRFFASIIFCLLIIFLGFLKAGAQTTDAPLRLAIIGLKHGHSPFIFERKDQSNIIVVGIYELDQELAKRYAKNIT